jgi:hypothetical protein
VALAVVVIAFYSHSLTVKDQQQYVCGDGDSNQPQHHQQQQQQLAVIAVVVIAIAEYLSQATSCTVMKLEVRVLFITAAECFTAQHVHTLRCRRIFCTIAACILC